MIATLVVSVGFTVIQPRTYEASAQIWFQTNWNQTSSTIGLSNQAGGSNSMKVAREPQGFGRFSFNGARSSRQ